MTLREQCEAFFNELKNCSTEEVPAKLEAFARQQQAVGLREAMAKADECVDLDDFLVWCEQRAREREGTP